MYGITVVYQLRDYYRVCKFLTIKIYYGVCKFLGLLSVSADCLVWSLHQPISAHAQEALCSLTWSHSPGNGKETFPFPS